jgi:hypothetical protein
LQVRKFQAICTNSCHYDLHHVADSGLDFPAGMFYQSKPLTVQLCPQPPFIRKT